MNLELVKKIADAVLYEGYILYPYRASAVKNRQRFNWGVLAPPAYGEAQKGTERSQMQTEVLVKANKDSLIDLKVRFLQLIEREIYRHEETTNRFCQVGSLEVDGKIWQTWQEAVEREVNICGLRVGELFDREPRRSEFKYLPSCEVEPLYDLENKLVGEVVRRQEELAGEVRIAVSDPGFGISGSSAEGVSKLTIRVCNRTSFEHAERKSRDQALAQSLVSTHIIFSITGGEYISLLEPPEVLSQAAAACENSGAFPVLAGAKGERDCMLSTPIILYDYPEIAGQSPGDLFDGAEIDEILTLRILTMTESEKREMCSIDEKARMILERSEKLTPEDFMKMHGALRSP